jgi:hypothetical protein
LKFTQEFGWTWGLTLPAGFMMKSFQIFIHPSIFILCIQAMHHNLGKISFCNLYLPMNVHSFILVDQGTHTYKTVRRQVVICGLA